jgi:hypothetical protein
MVGGGVAFVSYVFGVTEYWIPAFAGMTSGGLTVDEGMPALRSGMPPVNGHTTRRGGQLPR